MLRYCGLICTSIAEPGNSATVCAAAAAQQFGLRRPAPRCRNLAATPHPHFGDSAIDMIRMQKAFAIGRHFRRQRFARQPFDEIGRRADRVDHPPLGDRRMDVHAADRHRRQIGRKCFHVELAGAAAIERVANRRPELGDIDMIDAVADFLVAREANFDRRPRQLPDARPDARSVP